MPVFFGAGIATRSIKNKTKCTPLTVPFTSLRMQPLPSAQSPSGRRRPPLAHAQLSAGWPFAHWVVLYGVQQPACANGFSLMATDNLCTNMSVQWSTVIENDETHCSHTHWQYLMQPLNKDYKLCVSSAFLSFKKLYPHQHLIDTFSRIAGTDSSSGILALADEYLFLMTRVNLHNSSSAWSTNWIFIPTRS